MKKVTAMYFSPTNTTKIITETIASSIAELRDSAVQKSASQNLSQENKTIISIKTIFSYLAILYMAAEFRKLF